MKKLSFMLLLFVSCSSSALQENSDLPLSQNRDNPNVIQDEEKSSSAKTNFSPQNWEVMTNTAKHRSAIVSAIGKSPDGDFQAFLIVHCHSFKTENDLVTFTYMVSDTDKIPSFNFHDFEGPEAPAQKKELVEIQINLPSGKLSWLYAANGGFGDTTEYGEASAFWFSPSTLNKPDKTTQIAQMIARGSTEVIITVHDYKDNRKTIKTTFPAIDVSSNAAKILNGCHK